MADTMIQLDNTRSMSEMIFIFDGFADGQINKLAKMAVSCMRQITLTLSEAPGDCID